MVVKLGPVPMQTFFLPLPEEATYNTMFKVINAAALKPPVQTMFSVSISVDNTVVWYDHWEDGYELDVTSPNKTTTEVWGDRDASNGCSPTIKVPCTDANDFLIAGDSIVKQNAIEIPRDPKLIKYDGRDKIMASFGVTVTRGCFPSSPGSVMAGAVDVVETDNWGTEYIAPVGEDIGKTVAQGAFEFAAFYFMAAYDNTTVTLPNATRIVLNSGEANMITVNRGNRLIADKSLQVNFVGGDKDSEYELRWFSMLDYRSWSNEYVSPVGDTYSETKILMYNANDVDMDVSLTMWDTVTSKLATEVVQIKSKKHALTRYIPTGSGARVSSPVGRNFLALSISDTNFYTGADKVATGGQW